MRARGKAASVALLHGVSPFARHVETLPSLPLRLTSALLDQTNGKLKLIPAVEGVQLVPRPAGVACEGGINFGDLEFLQDASASDPLQDLMDNVDTLTPPLQSEGLDLGGIVLFSNPRLIAIETGGSVSFQDYVGVTGDIVPKP